MLFQPISTGHLPAVVALLVSSVALASRGSFVHASVNVGIEHDLSKPTYGLEGKSSSNIQYDTQKGLNMAGTVSDLLGPPIKIANGFNNLVKGSNMASMGTGLKTGGALLGFDAKLVEAAGAGNLFKGGLLLQGAQAKSQVAGQLAGPKGQKIANIVEVPVKVVAMKDIVEGKALSAMGAAKATGANQMSAKGQALMNQGAALKSQGLTQMIQGANEGVQNIGNMFQKTSDNVHTAFKLLPLIWDMQQQEAAETAKGQQQMQVQAQMEAPQAARQEHPVSQPYQMSSPTGGSLFGGLSSLIPGLSSSALSGNAGFGAGPNPGYAALWNTTSPLTNLLMSPSANPFLFPLTTGPMGQALVAKQPIGTAEASSAGAGGPLGSKGGLLTTGAGSQTYDFHFLPGVRYKETVSGALPTFSVNKQMSAERPAVAAKVGQQQQVAQQTQQLQMPQQQQQVEEAKNK